MITVDMGRTIGNQACVEISPIDNVVHAKWPSRTIASQIVCNKKPVLTSLLTQGMSIYSYDGLLTVFTAFPGPRAPMELTDSKLKNLSSAEQAQARMFWDTHALCSISCFGTHVPPEDAIVNENPLVRSEDI